MKRKVVMAVTLLLAFASPLSTEGFSACGSDSKNEPGTTSTASTGTASATPTATPVAEQKPAKLRFFYVTSGATVTDGLDYANNTIINTIAEKANVEIVEAIVPPWSDVSTKYNLMMSSGNICDVV